MVIQTMVYRFPAIDDRYFSKQYFLAGDYLLGSHFKVGREAAAAAITQASRFEIEILPFPLVPARQPCMLSLTWDIRDSKHDAEDVHGIV